MRETTSFTIVSTTAMVCALIFLLTVSNCVRQTDRESTQYNLRELEVQEKTAVPSDAWDVFKQKVNRCLEGD